MNEYALSLVLSIAIAVIGGELLVFTSGRPKLDAFIRPLAIILCLTALVVLVVGPIMFSGVMTR